MQGIRLELLHLTFGQHTENVVQHAEGAPLHGITLSIKAMKYRTSGFHTKL